MPKVRFKVNGRKARFESSTSKSSIIFMFKLSDQRESAAENGKVEQVERERAREKNQHSKYIAFVYKMIIQEN